MNVVLFWVRALDVKHTNFRVWVLCVLMFSVCVLSVLKFCVLVWVLSILVF